MLLLWRSMAKIDSDRNFISSLKPAAQGYDHPFLPSAGCLLSPSFLRESEPKNRTKPFRSTEGLTKLDYIRQVLSIHIPVHEVPLRLYPGRHEQVRPASVSLQMC